MNQLLKFMSGAAGYVPIPWNLDFAQLDIDESSKWDISTSDFMSSSGTVGDNQPESIRFKSDGTSFYVVTSSTSDQVKTFDLDVPWTFIGGITNANKSISLGFYERTPSGLDFKPDGTKVYVCGTSGGTTTPTRGIYEFDLSTAWDLSTSSFVQKFFESAMSTSPRGLTFKTDGTKMYLVDGTNDEIDEYNLTTAWDISTASYISNFSVSSQDTAPDDIYFKPDGTKIYVIGLTNDKVYEYDLSTPWSANTASYNQDFSVATEETVPRGLTFKPDGTQMYVTGSTGDDVNGYQLATKYFDLDDTLPKGIFFKPDGTKMYVSGSTGDNVREYNLSTAWDVTTASYLQLFSVSSQSSDPRGLFFKSDGTKMYVTGDGETNEYNLSTAWDITSSSFSYRFGTGSFDYNGPTIQPRDIFLKSDGTKMYLLATASDAVYEYDLSTAWDISTASYHQNFSVATQEDAAVGISFKTDGKMMFILGTDQNNDPDGYLIDQVHAYNLGADWDVSTANYSKSFNTHSFAEQSPTGLHFKPDGTKFYVTGSEDDRVYQYSISA